MTNIANSISNKVFHINLQTPPEVATVIRGCGRLRPLAGRCDEIEGWDVTVGRDASGDSGVLWRAVERWGPRGSASRKETEA